MQKAVVDLINDYLEQKDMSKAWLAKQLGQSRQSLNQTFKKRDLDCGYVLRVSQILEHDFFADLSKQLPVDIRAKSNKAQVSQLEICLRDFIDNNYPKIK